MNRERRRTDLDATVREDRNDDGASGVVPLSDARAINILTTEHWSLLSGRALGYQEILGRATVFVAILSATLVALALVAQATHFGRETLWLAALLFSVTLLIGLTTFARALTLNYEDARYVEGMRRLRSAYFEISPDVEPYFISRLTHDDPRGALAHGSSQRLANLASSITTTSGVVGVIDSILVGALAGDLAALFGAALFASAILGAVVSVGSGATHVALAARFRKGHPVGPTTPGAR
jgi:hypothetical protein